MPEFNSQLSTLPVRFTSRIPQNPTGSGFWCGSAMITCGATSFEATGWPWNFTISSFQEFHLFFGISQSLSKCVELKFLKSLSTPLEPLMIWVSVFPSPSPSDLASVTRKSAWSARPSEADLQRLEKHSRTTKNMPFFSWGLLQDVSQKHWILKIYSILPSFWWNRERPKPLKTLFAQQSPNHKTQSRPFSSSLSFSHARNAALSFVFQAAKGSIFGNHTEKEKGSSRTWHFILDRKLPISLPVSLCNSEANRMWIMTSWFPTAVIPASTAKGSPWPIVWRSWFGCSPHTEYHHPASPTPAPAWRERCLNHFYLRNPLPSPLYHFTNRLFLWDLVVWRNCSRRKLEVLGIGSKEVPTKEHWLTWFVLFIDLMESGSLPVGTDLGKPNHWKFLDPEKLPFPSVDIQQFPPYLFLARKMDTVNTSLQIYTGLYQI